MQLILAPMEGVIDHHMRSLLTKLGGVDRCVTEFIRITDHTLPDKVFLRYCPELAHGGKTPAGVPVYLQLLGGNAAAMAANADVAARLGAPGIDLNFGCPTKTVNRSDGGAVLLQQPQRLFAIISAVRNAVPQAIPVTAKIRLGFNDSSQFEAICDAVIAAGANALTIHARTRQDGYKPPAYWQHILAIKQRSPIPIIANGEIWNIADSRRCQQQSGCEDLMLGRGILACPDLARQIKTAAGQQTVKPLSWMQVLILVEELLRIEAAMYPAKHACNRVKQWLSYLRYGYYQAGPLFEDIKRLQTTTAIAGVLTRHRSLTAATEHHSNEIILQ